MAKDWTLIATHGVVLFHIAARPNATMRQMAAALSVTERRIAQVVRDLVAAGLIDVRKEGRRNVYAVNLNARFRHPTLSHVPVGRFVETLREPPL